VSPDEYFSQGCRWCCVSKNEPGTGTNHAPKSRNSGEYPVVSHQIFTPWSSVLLEKLTGSQLVKIFPTIYGTRRLITAFTSACTSPNTSGNFPYGLAKRETMLTDPLLIWRKAEAVISHLQYDHSRLTQVQVGASVSERFLTRKFRLGGSVIYS
jgi:hypothetical protein